MVKKPDGPKPITPEVVPMTKSEAVRNEILKYAHSRQNPTALKFIDWDEFRKAAERLMPLRDIAPLLGIHRNTLNDHCNREFNMTSEEVWEFFASKGKRVLTSVMYDKAVKENNTAMQMWLSKQHLGHREPDKGDPDPAGGGEPKQIVYSPKIKGFDGNKEDIQRFMMEFLDNVPQASAPDAPIEPEIVDG